MSRECHQSVARNFTLARNKLLFTLMTLSLTLLISYLGRMSNMMCCSQAAGVSTERGGNPSAIFVPGISRFFFSSSSSFTRFLGARSQEWYYDIGCCSSRFVRFPFHVVLVCRPQELKVSSFFIAFFSDFPHEHPPSWWNERMSKRAQPLCTFCICNGAPGSDRMTDLKKLCRTALTERFVNTVNHCGQVQSQVWKTRHGKR